MQIVLSDSTTSSSSKAITADDALRLVTCPSCGHDFDSLNQGGMDGLPAGMKFEPNDQEKFYRNVLGCDLIQGGMDGLPNGMKFDPNDQEILVHLEAKSMAAADGHNLHPLIDEFIPMLKGENGICYTHPEKLPGVSKDGQIRHFFHRPCKAYTTGTRKRRKVHADKDENETRWHKTGKTRPLLVDGVVKGYKKILVLYMNYGRQRKPEKTNWVMHQYHLGSNEEEKNGELVLSKVFYKTQPRQCGSGTKPGTSPAVNVEYYNFHDRNPSYTISYDQGRRDSGRNNGEGLHSPQLRLIPDSSYIRFESGSSKGKLASN